MHHATGRVVLRDEANEKWLEFSSPCRVITAFRIDDVIPLIRQIENSVQQEHLYAAGFISYEAAPAFDLSLPAKIDSEFPLIWFGLFKEINEITLPIFNQGQSSSIDWRPSINREEYDYRLSIIRSRIQAGDTYQVNFTYRLQSTTDVDPWDLFVQIVGDGEAPFAGFVDTGEWAICSASPELFLRIDDQQIESRPMKGTATRGLWFEDDQAKKETLLYSKKNQAENLMIVDMVRNDLGRIALSGSVHVSSLMKAEKYPTVWQLTSTVVAQTLAPLDRILQATFPPASITGAPKRRTMEIIAELESTPRRIYSGTIGFMAPNRQAQLNVAIRTILLHKTTGRAEYGVGGGIVWDSTAADEYEESQAKTRVLVPIPRDFDILETILWSYPTGYSLLELHLKRLAQSAEYFGYRADIVKIRSALTRISTELLPIPHRMRLSVSRLGGNKFEVVPLLSAMQCFGDIVLAKSPINKRDIFLYHKTTRRNEYDNALRMSPGYDDVLLFNEDGHITETTIANIAVEIDGQLCTPPVSCGLLPGTQRAWLLEQSLLRERILSVQEVFESSDIYLFNSIRGMQKVCIQP